MEQEQYGLFFRRPFVESEKGKKLLEVIRSDGFKKAVEALGGYEARRSGEILYRAWTSAKGDETIRFILAVIFFIVFTGPAMADPRWQAGKIDHRLFDASDCMEKIKTFPSGDGVDFYWGCGDKKYITMECVVDRAGYHDFGPQYSPPGWHCNWPLPALKLDGVNRIADVAVGSVGGKVAWAACFVNSYGDFNSRKKPYHDTACYRALKRIHRIVNQTQRDPNEVARELPQ